MTHHLSVEQVLFIHARLIDETGGEHGIRDLGMVKAAVDRPKTTFDGQELYPDIYVKAAALMESLVNNHAFLDGNKRTGITVVALFLLRNDLKISATNTQMVEFTVQVAQSQLDLGAIENWLRAHSKPL